MSKELFEKYVEIIYSGFQPLSKAWKSYEIENSLWESKVSEFRDSIITSGFPVPYEYKLELADKYVHKLEAEYYGNS